MPETKKVWSMKQGSKFVSTPPVPMLAMWLRKAHPQYSFTDMWLQALTFLLYKCICGTYRARKMWGSWQREKFRAVRSISSRYNNHAHPQKHSKCFLPFSVRHISYFEELRLLGTTSFQWAKLQVQTRILAQHTYNLWKETETIRQMQRY